jgi:hypothetical protein
MYYEPKGTMESPREEDLYGVHLPPIPKPYGRKRRTVGGFGAQRVGPSLLVDGARAREESVTSLA